MRVNVDRAICIGSGQCTLIAPDAFDQDSYGISYPLRRDSNLSTESDARYATSIREAEVGCPVQAIRVTDEETQA